MNNRVSKPWAYRSGIKPHTDTQPPQVEDKKAKQADGLTVKQPKPKHLKHPHASFLKDFVDPVHPATGRASLHNFVLEWLKLVEFNQEKQCQSGSYLHNMNAAPMPGEDADGSMPLPTSNSPKLHSPGVTTNSTPSNASVRDPCYRINNLISNRIDIRVSSTQLPGHISSHVEAIRAERESPSPSSEQITRDLGRIEDLEDRCDEREVEIFLSSTLFPTRSDPTYGRSAGLDTTRSRFMPFHLIPNNPGGLYRVSRPKPHLLYRYSGDRRYRPFTESQFLAQNHLHPQNLNFAQATASGLRLPFFAIEFKSDGPTGGSLWVAANQCAGASSAFVNAVEHLNALLPNDPAVNRVDNLSYSIAVDNTLAKLYISWKEEDLNYCCQQVGAFLLLRLKEFKSFRRQVRNILDWGKGARLTQIRDALDIILEQNQKAAAEQASAGQP